jgi:hypothetical protein
MKIMCKNFLLYLIGVSALILLNGCKKNSDQNDPPRGTISGKVIPSNASFAVRAVGANNKVYTSYPGSDGRFTFNTLPVGQYTFTAYPVGGFDLPADVSANVGEGKNPDLTTFQFTVNSLDGFASFKLDGTAFTAFYPASGAGFDQQPSFVFYSRTPFDESFSIRLSTAKGVGSYPIESDHNFNASVQKNIGGIIHTWSTTEGGGGVFTISSMDTTRRRMSGTFNFTAPPKTTFSTGTRTISEGIFTDLYYEVVL